MVVSGYTVRLSSVRTQAIEKKISSIEPEFESVLLPRTRADHFQSRIQGPPPSVEIPDNGTPKESSDSLPPKKQRMGGKTRSQSPVANLIQHPEGFFNGYESQTSTMSAKNSEKKSIFKQEEKESIPPSEQRNKRSKNKVKEQRERRNALARQRYKNLRATQNQEVMVHYNARRMNMSQKEKDQERERVRTLQGAKRDEINARKREKYRKNKIKNRQTLKTSSDEAEENQTNAVGEKKRLEGGVKARVNDSKKTTSTNDELPAGSRRYNLRQQRSSKIPGKPLDSVSISSTSAGPPTQRLLTGSDGEFSLGALANVHPTESSARVFSSPFGYASPLGSEGRFSRILEDLPLTEPEGHVPSQNTIQKVFEQFRNDELHSWPGS